MNASQSDALVFLGATGDLAHKKIFPSLQAMVKHGHLNVPVIGVAKAGWNLEQLRARAVAGVRELRVPDDGSFSVPKVLIVSIALATFGLFTVQRRKW